MSMFFNFDDDYLEDEPEKEKPICKHVYDWIWPTTEFIAYHCKKCGEFYK